MLLCVVFVFGVCYTPSAYYFFYVEENAEAYDDLFTVSIFAKSLNSAVNFLIYCVMGPNFRMTLKGLICSRHRHGLRNAEPDIVLNGI